MAFSWGDPDSVGGKRRKIGVLGLMVKLIIDQVFRRIIGYIKSGRRKGKA